MSCHGPTGEGLQALHAPALTRTHDWYLLAQLEHYVHGRRGAAKGDTWGATMRSMSTTLTGSQVKDVIAYINTLGNKE